jgi:23S rRNA (uracil1939-C5)-methyltransferase
LEIARLGGRGDGIAETPDGPVFVPLTAPGDRVNAALLGTRGLGRTARLVSLLRASPARVEPVCPHYGDCGGCALQHLAPTAEAAW